MSPTSSTAADLALLLFRLTVAVVFLAHGWNHIFGGGSFWRPARPRSQGKPAAATDTSFQPTSAEQA